MKIEDNAFYYCPYIPVVQVVQEYQSSLGLIREATKQKDLEVYDPSSSRTDYTFGPCCTGEGAGSLVETLPKITVNFGSIPYHYNISYEELITPLSIEAEVIPEVDHTLLKICQCPYCVEELRAYHQKC